MIVADAKPGTIIEILHRRHGVWEWTGHIYKIDRTLSSGRVAAWKRFRQGGTLLHPTVECRDVTNDVDAPTWRF